MVLLAAQVLGAQTAYRYEVVSIHRAQPGQTNSGFRDGPQGGMRAGNVTAMQVIAFSFGVQDFQIEGLPAWAKSERFEITFTPDRSEIVLGEKTSRAEFDGWRERQGQRMQAVLRDRFQLAQHTETREIPTYILTTAKGGHKLSAPAHPERSQSTNINGGRQIVGTTAPVKALAEVLTMVLGRPVRDETGLDGVFDFKLEWAPDPGMPLSGVAEGAADSGRASIFTAITEQLGLRLESRKGPAPVLVIDRIERPSEN